ncbi:hypothetical protein F7734_05830 [Scytonema sp. UIC 10036]|uniref:hypothetical protein n=1 Tax=Scytonema sp. UIC 10036 TaxID=2304196 RepID=UPI0012DA25A7|nr:hypothetical protein [Scytonema sp. UIC 10036]MUG92003.1 hypothetical protein [Scytonema sp. UIC 10036]
MQDITIIYILQQFTVIFCRMDDSKVLPLFALTRAKSQLYKHANAVEQSVSGFARAWRNFALVVTPTFAGILDKSIQPIARDRYLNAREMLSALQAPQTPVSATVASPPPAQVHAPTVLSPPIPQYAASSSGYQAAPALGLGTWQQAIIISSVIGTFFVSGLWMMQLFAPNSSQTTSNTSTTDITPISTPSAAPVASQTAPPQPIPTVTQFIPTQPLTRHTPTPVIPSNPVSISQSATEQTIRNWLAAKREVFGLRHHGELERRSSRRC